MCETINLALYANINTNISLDCLELIIQKCIKIVRL